MQVRIVNVDFYMHPPIPNLDLVYSEFRGSAIYQVPVLRIFGSIDTGTKTCLHVHGVFPYLYIPYDGQNSVDSVTYQLAAALDKAINVSLGQTSSNVHHVFKISLVSGIPYYGYHAKHHQFLKIYFYNPLIVKKACTLLQNGNILGKIFQPHEAHIPYILQFMIDYNLYGMSFVNLSEVKYRGSTDMTGISEELILPSTIQKMSICKLEIDALAEYILNHLEVNSQNLGLNPGIQALWNDEKQRRRNAGDDSLVENCLTQNRLDVKPTATHLAFLNVLKEKLEKPGRIEESKSHNFSVYPAETPKDNTKRILNASMIENHSNLGSQSSDSTSLDFTITPEDNEADITLDNDALKLLEVLNDLRENVETDSILSQAVAEQDSDTEQNEMDMSLPLGYVQTPPKIDHRKLDATLDELDDSYFDMSIDIPQLDGCDDSPPLRRSTRLQMTSKNVTIEQTSKGGKPSSNREVESVVESTKHTALNLSTIPSSTDFSGDTLDTTLRREIENIKLLDILLSETFLKDTPISRLKTEILNLVSEAEESQSQVRNVLKNIKDTNTKPNFDQDGHHLSFKDFSSPLRRTKICNSTFMKHNRNSITDNSLLTLNTPYEEISCHPRNMKLRSGNTYNFKEKYTKCRKNSNFSKKNTSLSKTVEAKKHSPKSEICSIVSENSVNILPPDIKNSNTKINDSSIKSNTKTIRKRGRPKKLKRRNIITSQNFKLKQTDSLVGQTISTAPFVSNYNNIEQENQSHNFLLETNIDTVTNLTERIQQPEFNTRLFDKAGNNLDSHNQLKRQKGRVKETDQHCCTNLCKARKRKVGRPRKQSCNMLPSASTINDDCNRGFDQRKCFKQNNNLQGCFKVYNEIDTSNISLSLNDKEITEVNSQMKWNGEESKEKTIDHNFNLLHQKSNSKNCDMENDCKLGTTDYKTGQSCVVTMDNSNFLFKDSQKLLTYNVRKEKGKKKVKKCDVNLHQKLLENTNMVFSRTTRSKAIKRKLSDGKPEKVQMSDLLKSKEDALYTDNLDFELSSEVAGSKNEDHIGTQDMTKLQDVTQIITNTNFSANRIITDSFQFKSVVVKKSRNDSALDLNTSFLINDINSSIHCEDKIRDDNQHNLCGIINENIEKQLIKVDIDDCKGLYLKTVTDNAHLQQKQLENTDVVSRFATRSKAPKRKSSSRKSEILKCKVVVQIPNMSDIKRNVLQADNLDFQLNKDTTIFGNEDASELHKVSQNSTAMQSVEEIHNLVEISDINSILSKTDSYESDLNTLIARNNYTLDESVISGTSVQKSYNYGKFCIGTLPGQTVEVDTLISDELKLKKKVNSKKVRNCKIYRKNNCKLRKALESKSRNIKSNENNNFIEPEEPKSESSTTELISKSVINMAFINCKSKVPSNAINLTKNIFNKEQMAIKPQTKAVDKPIGYSHKRTAERTENSVTNRQGSKKIIKEINMFEGEDKMLKHPKKNRRKYERNKIHNNDNNHNKDKLGEDRGINQSNISCMAVSNFALKANDASNLKNNSSVKKHKKEAYSGTIKKVKTNYKSKKSAPNENTIPISVHVPLLDDTFHRTHNSYRKKRTTIVVNFPEKFVSPKFRIVSSDRRPYRYLPKFAEHLIEAPVANFPNAKWHSKVTYLVNKYPPEKQIKILSNAVLEECNKIDVNSLSLGQTRRLNHSSLFPMNSTYSMESFSNFKRLVQAEFENCYNTVEAVVSVDKNVKDANEIGADTKTVVEDTNKADTCIQIRQLKTKLRNALNVDEDIYRNLLYKIEAGFSNMFKDIDEIKEIRTISFCKILSKHKEKYKGIILKNKQQNVATNKKFGTNTNYVPKKCSSGEDATRKSLLSLPEKHVAESNINDNLLKESVCFNTSVPHDILFNQTENCVNFRKPKCSKLDIFKYIKMKSLKYTNEEKVRKVNNSENGHIYDAFIQRNLFGFATKKDVDERDSLRSVCSYTTTNDCRNNSLINLLGLDKKISATDNKPMRYPVNQYNFLDGTCDSSSSDEDVIIPKTAKKRTKTFESQSTSKYTPLDVKYVSPTKDTALKDATSRIELQDNKTTNVRLTSKKLPNIAPKHRRKLSFSQICGLDSTQIQEKVTCRFTPQKCSKTQKKIYIDCDSTNSESSANSCNEKILPIEVCEINLGSDQNIQESLCSNFDKMEKSDVIKLPGETIERSDKKESDGNIERCDEIAKKDHSTFSDIDFDLDKTLTPPCRSSSSSAQFSDDLFSPASDEITNVQKADPAEKYDVEKRFVPLAGSSKMDPQFQKLSQFSQNTCNSSSNDVLTPYQKENDAHETNDNKMIKSYESSQNERETVKIPSRNETVSSIHINTDSANDVISGHFEKLDTSELRRYEPICQNQKEGNEILMVTPKYNPPSREMVENSMKTYNIPEVRHQEPFYSNRNDVTGNMEIGKNVLRIPSNNVMDLPQFKSNFAGIEHQKRKILQVLEVDKKKLSAKQILEYKLSICKDFPITITPGRLPPNRKEVEEWIEEQKRNKQTATCDKQKQRKNIIFLPNSPGRDGDESFESLSLSPCTPIDANSTILKIDINKFDDNNSDLKSDAYKVDHNRTNISKLGNDTFSNNKINKHNFDNCCLDNSPPLKEKSNSDKKKRRTRIQQVKETMVSKKISDGDSTCDSKVGCNILRIDQNTSKLDDNSEISINKSNKSKCNPNHLETEPPNPKIEQSKSQPGSSKIDQSKISIIDQNNSNTDCGSSVDQNNKIDNYSTSRSKSESTILSSNDTIIKNLASNTIANSHQITGATLDNTNNFLMSAHNLNQAKALKELLNLTILSIEVIVITRNEYKPNPELDQIKAIVFTLSHNETISNGGFIINSLPDSPSKTKLSILDGVDARYNLKPVSSELELINEFVEYVKYCDPDIFIGFEIEMLSWGFLIERGYVLELNLTILLSRTPKITRRRKLEDEQNLVIPGRILIDFWRLLRHEIALTAYTFENVVYHILHQRIPLFSYKDLTYWLQHPTSVYRNRVIKHYFFRTNAILQIMEQLDLIGRTSELAKLFGIQFYEVLSRGSQFRVESMMLRLAKPLNFIPVSPSQQQRVKMRAPESLPLIMEPESKFYADPVIVLDFQSLYPSMMIAYNYCFSTCLGRIEHLGKVLPFEFGATQLKISRKYLKYFLKKEKLNISPCGVIFVNKSIRLGILPRMLQEILDTRLMVKKSLKENAGNKVLEKVLDARQLGLKLIANVTYGYTAANFSGRMPCIELGDSVVSKGRETLQRAINLVEQTPHWGAKVVYGDTDSLFVLIPGKSKETAFKIGEEIAKAVTNDNPSPVKLKLEKVFQPCILQTKKRYVGYMYESVHQSEPEFLAKGIETVRRDGCPASAKMLEKCLKILFDTRDVSIIKKYVTRQFSKLLTGRVSIQDLTFAKEYRGSSNYRPGACVPALELARKWTSVDKRGEPRRGERVPYVIVNGPPGQPLIKLVRSPRDLLNDPSLRPNAIYYITKAIIPPINRCLLLIGADLNHWFNEMPRKQYQYLPTSSPGKNKTRKNTISQFFSSLNCAICGNLTQDGLCANCKLKPQESSVLLHEKLRLWERNYHDTVMICQSCCGRRDEISCISLDCPVYYRRIQTDRDLQQSGFIRQLVDTLSDLEF